jgi:hypothetical protein
MNSESEGETQVRLSDEQAQLVLARAFALDADRQNGLSIAQLRAVATELGVESISFDRAIAEFRSARSPRMVAVSTNARPPFAVRHFGPIALAFVLLSLQQPVLTILGLHGPGNVLAALPLFVGAYVAHRWRATATRTFMVGYAVAILVDEFIHWQVGYPKLGQGSVEHWGIPVAAFLAAALTQLLSWRAARPVTPSLRSSLVAGLRIGSRRVLRAVRVLIGAEARRRDLSAAV